MTSNSPGKCLFAPKKQLNIIKSLKKLYDSEPFLEKLNILLPMVDTIDIKSFLSMQIKLTEKKLYMQESLLPNKKKIWNTKLNLLEKNFLNIQSLKTLAQDLILKEKDLSPFWNRSCMETSKKLWLPTMTGLQELDLTLYCSYAKTSIHNLPYSQIKTIKNQKMNSQMNLYQSLPITQQSSMECENMTYSRKIRFYPTPIQKEIFKKFFGASRYLYNKTIDSFKNKKDEKFSLSLSKTRNKIMKNNKDITNDDPELWLKDIPYDTRQLAIKNALSSIKSSFELLKNKKIKYFNHKYKSKKNNKQTFFIDHRAIKNLNLFPNLLKDNSKLIVKKKYKEYYNYIPTSDALILKDNNKYFIIFSKEKKIEENTTEKKELISLDPGIKKFQSFYTPDGYVGSIGDYKLKNKILKKEKRIDKLKSFITKNKKQKIKNKLKNKCYKLKTKVKNIISDFHWKISNFLTKNFKIVLLPIFKSQQIKNNLNSYNNRLLDIYSHYKFQQKMLYQSKKYNCQVKIVEENYTTKTCGNCGCINNFVGNSNIFWCPICKIELERDYQAARNIILKNLQGLTDPLQ